MVAPLLVAAFLLSNSTAAASLNGARALEIEQDQQALLSIIVMTLGMVGFVAGVVLAAVLLGVTGFGLVLALTGLGMAATSAKLPPPPPRAIDVDLLAHTRTVETHVQHILQKLGIPADTAVNRRVHAVLVYLRCPAPRGQPVRGRGNPAAPKSLDEPQAGDEDPSEEAEEDDGIQERSSYVGRSPSVAPRRSSVAR